MGLSQKENIGLSFFRAQAKKRLVMDCAALRYTGTHYYIYARKRVRENF